MKNTLLILSSLIFTAYGIAFVAFPALASQLITGGVPSTTSGLIDMRATYGGMSLAIGAWLAVAAYKSEWVTAGLLSVLFIMIGMAASRLIGIVVDGSPNPTMWIYLGVEIVAACALLLALRKPG